MHPLRYRLRLIEQLSSIDADAWDALATGHASLSHAFLSTLEDCGCVGHGTGWRPCHVTLWDGETLVGALPLYEKDHSYGEYVFDWAWADAYARHGLAYYPKLLAAIPFTPIPGPRLLARDASCRRALIDTALAIAQASDMSSLHVLLPTADEGDVLADAGLLIRRGVQFHWRNRGYADFDDFLARLNHDKRKKIRQERRRAAAHGLTCQWLDGRQAREADWRFFHRCYCATYALHRSVPYLNLDFFVMLAARAPETVRLLVAKRGDEPVASAFFLCDAQALYGRYWGATEHLPFVHFELCYYQAIDYCIATARQRFEGGAQGEHKLARGLEPVVTRSAHWIRDSRFRDAVDRFLAQERAGVAFYLDELSERTPFRDDGRRDR
jgi:predicted N-acyltransferase